MRVSPAQKHMLILQTFHSLLKVSLFPYMFNFSIPLAKTTLELKKKNKKKVRRVIRQYVQAMGPGGRKGERFGRGKEGEREREFIFENIILICFKRTESAATIS